MEQDRSSMHARKGKLTAYLGRGVPAVTRGLICLESDKIVSWSGVKLDRGAVHGASLHRELYGESS